MGTSMWLYKVPLMHESSYKQKHTTELGSRAYVFVFTADFCEMRVWGWAWYRLTYAWHILWLLFLIWERIENILSVSRQEQYHHSKNGIPIGLIGALVWINRDTILGRTDTCRALVICVNFCSHNVCRHADVHGEHSSLGPDARLLRTLPQCSSVSQLLDESSLHQQLGSLGALMMQKRARRQPGKENGCYRPLNTVHPLPHKVQYWTNYITYICIY